MFVDWEQGDRIEKVARKIVFFSRFYINLWGWANNFQLDSKTDGSKEYVMSYRLEATSVKQSECENFI